MLPTATAQVPPSSEVGPSEPAPSENPPWSGWDVLRIVVVGVVAIAICSIGILTLALRRHHHTAADLERDPLLILPAQAIAYVVIVIFMYVLVTRERRKPFWSAVRWNFPQHWYAFGAIGVIVAISGQMLSALLPIPKSLPIDQFFRNPADAYAMAAFGVLLAPFVEEMFFRGFLYPVLARRLGVRIGVVLTALPFALLHSSQLGSAWGPLLVLFVVGLVLTGVRAVTKSVAASTLVHMGYNFTLFAMLFVASGRFQHLERISQ